MNKPKTIPALTSIRGVAALFVLCYHIAGSFSSYEFSFFKLFHNGSLSVDLFFVLSGFIMHHVYCASSDLSKFPNFFTSFMMSRIARLYPLHIITLLILVIILLVLPDFSNRYAAGTFTYTSFLFNLLLIQNWGFIGPSWNLVSWSISAEWFMYLLFPFMLICSRYLISFKLKWFYLFFTLVILSTHYLVIYLLQLDGYGGISLGGMIQVFFEFSLGFCVYGFREHLIKHEALKRSDSVLGSLMVLTLISIAWQPFFYMFLPVAALLVLNLSIANNNISRQFERKTMIWLGDISYSLYMWHWIVIQLGNYALHHKILVINGKVDLLLFFIVATVISLILAHYSYIYVEKKGQRFILSYFKSKKEIRQ